MSHRIRVEASVGLLHCDVVERAVVKAHLQAARGQRMHLTAQRPVAVALTIHAQQGQEFGSTAPDVDLPRFVPKVSVEIQFDARRGMAP